MKKILSLLLALLIILSMVACMPSVPAQPSAPEQPIVLPTVAPQTPEEPEEPDEPTPLPVVEETEPPQEPEEPAAPEEPEVPEKPAEPEEPDEPAIDEHGTYTSKDEVALYIHTYGHLPENFITKKAAEKLGWQGGSLEPFAPGKSIGGSHFGNYEGLLPEKKGREYTECDIDTLGKKSRGAKRIVFSNDGLIYYTDDHYESFTLLYGEE